MIQRDSSDRVESRFTDILIRFNLPVACCRDFRSNIVEALHWLGEFSGQDRIQILEVRPDMTYRVIYEWCRKGLVPLEENHRRHAVFYDEALEQQLNRQNYIVLHEAEMAAWPELKELMEEQQCRQLLLLPLYESGAQFAFVGFMQCEEGHEWSEEEIRTLEDITAVLSRQLDNYRITRCLFRRLREEKKLKEETELLHRRLQQLHRELMPEWEQLKKRLSIHEDFRDDPGVDGMNGRVETLDEICRRL